MTQTSKTYASSAAWVIGDKELRNPIKAFKPSAPSASSPVNKGDLQIISFLLMSTIIHSPTCLVNQLATMNHSNKTSLTGGLEMNEGIGEFLDDLLRVVI